MEIVAKFEIPYYQYLDHEGNIIDSLPAFAKDTQHLIHLYKLMVLNRVFDTKAIALQRTGKIGTYPSTRGQEGTFVGVGAAMAKDDIFVPYYRDVGILMQRGVRLSDILLYWGGDERGNLFASATNNFPFSVPVGSQLLHAAGVATALKIQGKKNAVVTLTGEGGTSEGDFYEAINVAGVWKLPVVFVASNNQWAISVPRSAQTAAETIAQKAIAAGFPGEQVDGNDVIAVYERTEVALQRAREEHIPTLLEIISYRQSDHTTADDASRYETKGIRESEWIKEPLIRLRKYLEKQNAWNQAQEDQLQTECVEEVERNVTDYLNTKSASVETIFDYLYEKLPKIYDEQRDQLIAAGITQHG